MAQRGQHGTTATQERQGKHRLHLSTQHTLWARMLTAQLPLTKHKLLIITPTKGCYFFCAILVKLGQKIWKTNGAVCVCLIFAAFFQDCFLFDVAFLFFKDWKSETIYLGCWNWPFYCCSLGQNSCLVLYQLPEAQPVWKDSFSSYVTLSSHGFPVRFLTSETMCLLSERLDFTFACGKLLLVPTLICSEWHHVSSIHSSTKVKVVC